jgi:asparagine synthase (glutamine-hydrolysing)
MIALVGMVSSAPSERRREILNAMLGSLIDAECQARSYSVPSQGVEIGWIDDARRPTTESTGVHVDHNHAIVLHGELIGGGSVQEHLDRYADIGLEFVAGLNGRFAGLLLDMPLRQCFLFNDRFGITRMFVHERAEGVFFASAARALLAAFTDTRSFDPDGLAERITCGGTLGARSLFKDIGVLPGGVVWTLQNGRIVHKSSYFKPPEWEQQSPTRADLFAEEIYGTVPVTIRKHAVASAPVGISLTGGLDCRMIMACLDGSPGQFPCYTFGSMYRDTFDVTAARAVAQSCRQSHTTLVLGAAFLNNFANYMERAVVYSDGYIGMSGAAELYLNQLAREIAPVRLTGNYGSELLRGERAFKASMPEPGLATGEFKPLLARACERFADISQVHPVSFTLFHQAPSQGYGRSAIEESQVTVRAPFMDNAFCSLAYRAPGGYSSGTQLSVGLIADQRPGLLDIPTDRGQIGRGALLSRWARRAHRELLFKAEYWANHGMPQAVAATLRHLPGTSPESYLLGRHKFHHFRTWLGDQLASYVRDVLAERNRELSQYVDAQYLSSMMEAHFLRRRNYSTEIDTAMTMALTERMLFQDGNDLDREVVPVRATSTCGPTNQ